MVSASPGANPPSCVRMRCASTLARISHVCGDRCAKRCRGRGKPTVAGSPWRSGPGAARRAGSGVERNRTWRSSEPRHSGSEAASMHGSPSVAFAPSGFFASTRRRANTERSQASTGQIPRPRGSSWTRRQTTRISRARLALKIHRRHRSGVDRQFEDIGSGVMARHVQIVFAASQHTSIKVCKPDRFPIEARFGEHVPEGISTVAGSSPWIAA
jgi:hypothetical protein